MNPLLFQSPREVMRDFMPDPDSRSIDPVSVAQVLERRRHSQYRSRMLKLRLLSELKAFRLWLFSAEHRLMAGLNGLIHPHSRPVRVRARKHRW